MKNNINPAILNIGGNRVGDGVDKRFPAQMFVDDDTALILDKQSGMIKSGDGKKIDYDYGGSTIMNQNKSSFNQKRGKDYGDTGGCSKILQKISKDVDNTI